MISANPKRLRRKDGKTKFHGHERMGSEIAKIIAKRLKLSNDELDCFEEDGILAFKARVYGG